jgi:hypothetical protein
MSKSKKVFLGGTCNGSQWREQLIPSLDIDYFNPVVDDWNEEAYQRELEERESCDFCTYVITPKMTGVYAIAEAVDDSNKRPSKTLFCYLEYDEGGARFTEGQLKSLRNVGRMIANNGGMVFVGLGSLANYLNSHA